MKKWICAAILASSWAVGALTGGLSEADRMQLVQHLEESRRAFLQEVQGLTAAQLQYRPNPDSWTVFDCAEHIAISEDNMFQEFHERLMVLEPKPGVKPETTDESVLEYGRNRQVQKSKAPASYKPVGRWKSLDEIVDHFKESRAATLNLARSTTEDLRGRYYEPFKTDAYQYLLFIATHCQRHTNQIKEIKASPGFPKP